MFLTQKQINKTMPVLRALAAGGATGDELMKFVCGYTKTELVAAFETLQKRANVISDVIDSYCTCEEINLVENAINCYTGTEPRFDYCRKVQGAESRNDLLNMKLLALGFKIGDHVLYVTAKIPKKDR